MIKTFTINKGKKPTEEQLQEVMKAKKRPMYLFIALTFQPAFDI